MVPSSQDMENLSKQTSTGTNEALYFGALFCRRLHIVASTPSPVLRETPVRTRQLALQGVSMPQFAATATFSSYQGTQSDGAKAWYVSRYNSQCGMHDGTHESRHASTGCMHVAVHPFTLCRGLATALRLRCNRCKQARTLDKDKGAMKSAQCGSDYCNKNLSHSQRQDLWFRGSTGCENALIVTVPVPLW